MLSLPAFAKLNLGLEVLGKRVDGYHDIQSVMCRISLHDELRFESNDTVVVHCDALAHENANDNLAYKAAMSLRRAYGVMEGAKITIQKHIPIGAGLGGGSSDAATTLMGLRRLWNLNCSISELYGMASELGADVPFFLHTGPCIASGTGTTLSDCRLSLAWSVLLVSPSTHISTALAYAGLNRGTDRRPSSDLLGILAQGSANPTVLRETLHNDFEDSVFQAHPELGRLKQRLLESGAEYAAMSGSGSSLFGLYASRSMAEDAARHFSELRTEVCDFILETSIE